jgi:uncharacterized protein
MDMPRALLEPLAALPRAVLAFSGGLDSGLLAALAQQALGARLTAVTVRSAFTAARDLDLAQTKARLLGLDHHIMDLDVWGVEGLAANGPERCYLCKRAVLGLVARTFPGAALLEGTNADDDPARPGRRAVAAAGALYPQAAAGRTNAHVRRLSAEIGQPRAAAPSNSCLATRIPRDTALTPRALARVEALEEFLRGLGFSALRCRDQGATLRLELPADQIRAARQRFDPILARAKAAGFTGLSLGERPRT